MMMSGATTRAGFAQRVVRNDPSWRSSRWHCYGPGTTRVSKQTRVVAAKFAPLGEWGYPEWDLAVKKDS